ncbi:MAG: hypothetical protein NC898_06250, partial [Candidatus Omnitrophica bacterium]|nr:hypothetical protein [Candidatus Omnitrophota bacterium]
SFFYLLCCCKIKMLSFLQNRNFTVWIFRKMADIESKILSFSVQGVVSKWSWGFKSPLPQRELNCPGMINMKTKTKGIKGFISVY